MLLVYLRLPTYKILLPFQELLLAAFFSASEQFFFVMLHAFAGFETVKNPTKPAEKARRAQNVETETAKKRWTWQKFIANRR